MAGLRPEEYVLCNNIEWIEKADCWKGLKGIGMVKSTIYHTKSKKETTETRYDPVQKKLTHFLQGFC